MKNPDNKNDILSKIYNLIDKKINPSFHNLNAIFSFFGTLFVIFLFSSYDGESANVYYILYIFGMVILYILTIFNTVKLVPEIEQFLKIPLTKFILALFISFYFAYASVQTSIDLNAVFSVPASNFKTSMFFGTFLYFLTHLVIILKWYVVAVIVIYFSNYLMKSYVSKEEGFQYLKGLFEGSNWKFQFDSNVIKLVVVSVFLFGILHLQSMVLNVDSMRYKLYIIAINYDFDSKNSCKNNDGKYPVAYIGSNSDKVIINQYTGIYNVEILKLEKFLRDSTFEGFNKNLSIIKESFKYDKCLF